MPQSASPVSRPAPRQTSPRTCVRRAGSSILVLALALIPLLIGGCATSADEAPPAPSEPEVSARSYRTVVVDSNGRSDHEAFVCYLAQANVTASDYGDEKESVVYIQDENFVDIGFYLSSGAAYRLEVDREGNIEQTFLGNHEPSRCIEMLTGVPGPFLFRTGV